MGQKCGIALLLAFLAGLPDAFSAPSLEKLTSKKAAKKARKKIPGKKSPSHPPIPHELKIHSLGIGVGQTFLRGDFAHYGADKITADLFYNYSASHSFDLLMGLHFSEHKLKGNRLNLSAVTAGVKGKLYQIDSFAPIVIAGLGFYRPVVTRQVGDERVKSKSRTVFGAHGGIGGELSLNRRCSVGFTWVLHNPFDVQQDVGSEIEGSYTKLMVNVFYRF